MRVVLQRVRSASVTVQGHQVIRIGRGLLALVGIGRDDKQADVEYVVGKICNLRLFDDDSGSMCHSVVDVDGEIMLVSQFTLYGDCRRGRRPSFDQAASASTALEIYNSLVASLRSEGVKVRTGKFQATMDVELINEGPVTLIIDSNRVL